MHKVDYVVYIGRFQPFHEGHKVAVDQALKASRKKVIILVGSSEQPRNIKNPFTFEERKAMIQMGVMYSDVVIEPLHDYTYNDQRWVEQVQKIVERCIARDGWADKDPTIGIIGYNKDETSYYLDMFPQWVKMEHEVNEVIDATDIRALLYTDKSLKFICGVVDELVLDFLRTFQQSEAFERLRDEYLFIQDYKIGWSGTPYPPTFLTVDAVVIQSGHVLLVERRAQPGKGQLALPGGFVNQYETCENAMLRELREETRLKVPEPVLRGNIKASRLFDDPWRSLRGRTVTQAFLIELKPGELPPVKGGDDAAKAQWVALSDVRQSEMFEDHYHILQWFLGHI